MRAAACQVPASLKESPRLTHSQNKPKKPPTFPFNPTTSPAPLGTSGCLRGPRDAERTYLNDFTILSALPAGWAPGDSFLRLKMPSLFFMSLALGAEAEKGGQSAWHARPLQPQGGKVARSGGETPTPSSCAASVGSRCV